MANQYTVWGRIYFANKSNISEDISSGVVFEENLFTGSPLRFIRNFVKFHLIELVPNKPGFSEVRNLKGDSSKARKILKVLSPLQGKMN